MAKIPREIVTLDWTQSRLRASLPCIIAVAACLAIGIACGKQSAGMLAASGAMCVGFGAFQKLGRSSLGPMIFATVGISICSVAGSISSHSPVAVTITAAVAGFVCAILTAVSPGAAWIALQCAIFALVASGYPTDARGVRNRALLMLAGGLAQVLIVRTSRLWRVHFRAPEHEDPFSGVGDALRIVVRNLTWRSQPFRYAVQLALTLAVATVVAHLFALSNAYWVPMTALLVMKPEAQQTFTRGAARVIGTIIGAGVATVLASALRPGPIALAALIVLCVWACYALLLVNYAVFTIAVTSYIAFLLSLAGLPEHEIAVHRVANTALGGVIALLAFAPSIVKLKRRTHHSAIHA